LCLHPAAVREQDQPGAPERQASGSESSQDEYDPHDVPITDAQIDQLKRDTAEFGGAVQTIKDLCQRIEDETRDGIPQQPYEAHQALDKADLVLQWLPQIARDSGVAKDQWEQINVTANELRTALDTIHHRIDNKEEPDYASVSQDVGQKISQLEEITTSHAGTN
jgi:hypothetical protein